MKYKRNILIITMAIIILIAIVLYFFDARDGWRRDKRGRWQRIGNPSEEVPLEIIKDCFGNIGNISAGLLVGDCQKRLCAPNGRYCKQKITKTFKEAE